MTPKAKSRLIFIGLCVMLMAAAVYVAGESLQQAKSGDSVIEDTRGFSSDRAVIMREAGVFRGATEALRIANQPSVPAMGRSLRTFYERRAYPGAPPYIPHTVSTDMDESAPSCLSCHERGGYVSKEKAYAPLTPHPEMENCRQCHVSLNTETLFQETSWVSVSPPKTGYPALPGGPPPIPHKLQMRENCLTCHAGSAAVKEIRSSHPERVNCRQCHAAIHPNHL